MQCSPDCNYLFWSFDSVPRVFIRRIGLLNFRVVVYIYIYIYINVLSYWVSIVIYSHCSLLLLLSLLTSHCCCFFRALDWSFEFSRCCCLYIYIYIYINLLSYWVSIVIYSHCSLSPHNREFKLDFRYQYQYRNMVSRFLWWYMTYAHTGAYDALHHIGVQSHNSPRLQIWATKFVKDKMADSSCSASCFYLLLAA